jgi:hypothetical protein
MKRVVAFLVIAAILGAGGYFAIGFLTGKKESFTSVGDPIPIPPIDNGDPKTFSTMRKHPGATEAFTDAKIAFQTPGRMQIGKSKDVKLILNLKKSIEELKAELGKEFPTGGATVDASPIMEATLSGGAFDIRAANPARQAIRDSGNTTWEWSIVPREKGQQTLKLRLYAIVTLGGTSAPLEVKTFERDIPVDVSIPELVLTFAKENIQLLWLVLVVPIAGFLSRLFGGKAEA